MLRANSSLAVQKWVVCLKHGQVIYLSNKLNASINPGMCVPCTEKKLSHDDAKMLDNDDSTSTSMANDERWMGDITIVALLLLAALFMCGIWISGHRMFSSQWCGFIRCIVSRIEAKQQQEQQKSQSRKWNIEEHVEMCIKYIDVLIQKEREKEMHTNEMP